MHHLTDSEKKTPVSAVVKQICPHFDRLHPVFSKWASSQEQQPVDTSDDLMDLSPLRNQSSSGKARNSLHKTIPTTATATTSAKRGKKQKQEEFFYAALESALKAQNERAQMQLNLNEKRLAFEKARMEKMREREGAWLEYARRREEIAQKRQELELKREERAQEREDFEQKKREAEQEMHAQLLAWDKKILRLRNESARLDALVERAEARHKLKTIVSKQELDALFPDLAFIGEKN